MKAKASHGGEGEEETSKHTQNPTMRKWPYGMLRKIFALTVLWHFEHLLNFVSWWRSERNCISSSNRGQMMANREARRKSWILHFNFTTNSNWLPAKILERKVSYFLIYRHVTFINFGKLLLALLDFSSLFFPALKAFAYRLRSTRRPFSATP